MIKEFQVGKLYKHSGSIAIICDIHKQKTRTIYRVEFLDEPDKDYYITVKKGDVVQTWKEI